ncbi:hypothetical protein PT974_11857 [Cladobotryum mycophilum]|uniref:Alpha/beta hydrolase fold-3 domain-containing protein n=1 Tax=Cladobotryum mycophilum TaxID=491253 RepID=A0ABR0S6Z5_9HYPO
MPPWSVSLSVRRLPIKAIIYRRLSTQSQQTVRVRIGSEGYVTVDLHNFTENPSADALIVHIPPFAFRDESSVRPIPGFLRDWPVAIHDTAFAFRWITENLMPPNNGRGNIIVYGSYLGASLAASLSLTETRSHSRFSIRGFAAYNGIYNWTMFLPDHQINITKISPKSATVMTTPYQSTHMNNLQKRIESLFDTPSNLFDPFASPSLFFHTPGILVPSSFYMSATEAAMLNAKTGYEKLFIKALRPPQQAHLTFPPVDSMLKIPQALLLHDSISTNPPQRRQAKPARYARMAVDAHNFRAQAKDLSTFMKRSIDIIELTDQGEWDDDVEQLAGEAHGRVQVADVGQERKDLDLSEAGQNILLSWIRDRI